jgi:hypothetical protein
MRSFSALAASALLCTCSFAQHAKPDSKATFSGLYKQAEAIFAKKDAKALYAGLTNDFTETINGRTMKKEQSRNGLQQFMNMFQTLHCKFTIKSCTIVGRTAMTKDSVHLWGPSSRLDPKTHKRGTIEATRDETFTWVKQNGRWMVRGIGATNQKILVNGKAMPMTGRA